MPTAFAEFGLHEMLRCSNGIRASMREGRTMEAAARNAARYLYDELVDENGARACALVRVYKTHPYAGLEPGQKEFARRMLEPGTTPVPGLRCLTLLATVGDQPEWNDRRRSAGHQAIPLPTAAVVARAPMVAALIRSFGVDISAAVNPAPELMKDIAGKTYGVFHVEDAHGSEHIPAQDFVDRHDIHSVIGFGGSLANGDLFATLAFTRVIVSRSSADRFRNIALDIKSRFFAFQPHEIFDAPVKA